MGLKQDEWKTSRLGNCTEFVYYDHAGDQIKLDVWPDGEWVISITDKRGAEHEIQLSERFLREVLAEYGRWVSGTLPD